MTNTANETFTTLAALVERYLPPGLGFEGKIDVGGLEARRMHTASTLRQWAKWAGDTPLAPSDLALAYTLLGMRAAPPGPLKSRRLTCRQLAALADQAAEGDVPGNTREQALALERCGDVWLAVVASLGDDPRHASIKSTSLRETGILQQAAADLWERHCPRRS